LWLNIIISQEFESAKPIFELKEINPYQLFKEKPNFIWFFKDNNSYIMEGYFKEDENFKKITIILDSLSYAKIINNYGKYRENLLIHYLTSQALISYLLYSDFANTIEIPQSFVKPLRVLFPVIYTGYSYILTLKFYPISGSMVYASSYGAISSYIKNYLVLDMYERIIWSMLENNLYFFASYYIKPQISHITRSLFLTTLFYYNYYAFEGNIFETKSSIISSALSFSNVIFSNFDRKTTNGDVLFEAFSSFSFGFSAYNLTLDHKKSAISSNLGYILGFLLSQRNNISLSKSVAIGISSFLITYTLTGLIGYKNEIYSISPLILYLNYFAFTHLFKFF
jgi:hypothetical protein